MKAGGSLLAEPFGSLDGGRMAIVADPSGAVFGLWTPGAHRGAQRINEPSAYLQVRFSGLRRDLAHYLHDYNHHREHHGGITAGRRPADLVYGAHKMEPR